MKREQDSSLHPPSRREFLQAGSLAAIGLAGSRPSRLRELVHGRRGRSCILLLLTGGPSHLDTFDPKPDAPAEIRGPFRPLRTNVRGISLSELLPKTARQADKFAVVRSVYHTAAGVHETGFQQLQTGWLFEGGLQHPHVGCVAGYLRGTAGELPAHVLLPGELGNIGGGVPHGQTAGFLGRQHDPVLLNPDVDGCGAEQLAMAADMSGESAALCEAYGRTEFGKCCLAARRLVERGVQFVTINMYRAVHCGPTWDAHGSQPFGKLADYERTVAPAFDRGYSTLLADLSARGLLADTLVVAAGEFGRSPRMNPVGGRHHWPGCWSILLAGGGVKGGQVLGASDKTGSAPADRPVRPSEVCATMYHSLGIDLAQMLPGPDGRQIPLVADHAAPLHELF